MKTLASQKHRALLRSRKLLQEKDPVGANLDRIQIVKCWVDAAGEPQERIIDVVWSDGRVPGADAACPPSATRSTPRPRPIPTTLARPTSSGTGPTTTSIHRSPRSTTCA
ncbi:DUF3604 domain-containing protein [Paracoccus sp. EF6]|uniref:DUF3604 domain-containing protein n=1 Tax=Paracoccus benzoatiresistens TaxID=2997341 RepID=A0ABT4J9F6_9RHOB|nr:DUF3604 domain-containing protein [Paracoccus sp. EF6]MCZ0963768.1 DUF3604 domain-containing protein [Paracoccus sp. EF6]